MSEPSREQLNDLVAAYGAAAVLGLGDRWGTRRLPRMEVEEVNAFPDAQLELTFDAPTPPDATDDVLVYDEPNRRQGHLRIDIDSGCYLFLDMGGVILFGATSGPSGYLSPEQLRVIGDYCNRAADRTEVTRLHKQGDRACIECGEKMPCSAIQAVVRG